MHICHVAFPISKSAYTHFKKKKIYLQNKTKTRTTPTTQVNAPWVQHSWVPQTEAAHTAWPVLHRKDFNRSRQGVSFRRETPVRQTIQCQWDDLHAFQVWVPNADSHVLCSCFRLPAAKASPGTRSDQNPPPFLPSALPKHVLAATGLSLFFD